MIPGFQAYVGPQPFEEKDKAIFFGRNREARDLLSLVIAHNIVLVYAQSGAGKTSLINAGLIPLLKKSEFEVLPVARVKGEPKDIKIEEISNIFVFNALTSLAEGGYDEKNLAKKKLVDFLNARKHKQDEDGLPLPRAMIFDQFEEMFSLYQDRWKDREGFFEQVSDALEADPLLRIVFVMREDFIAQLDPYAYLLPERLRTRFHIERLRLEEALMAVKGPLRYTGRSFAEGVAEKLVDDLLKIRVESIPCKPTEALGEFIEAVQLQVVCQNLWKGLPSDVKQITSQHLKTYGDVEQELSKFYEEAIKTATKKAGIDEERLRILFGEVLITKMETRGMVYRAPESTGDVPNEAIDMLESMHLIRAESRAGAHWYELTHDRFIKPILDSNKVFNEKLAEKRRTEREKEEKERAEKEWLEKERVEKERAEKEKAEKERAEKELRVEKELAKSRRLIIKGLAVFSIIVLILAGFATYLWVKSDDQKKTLENQKDALKGILRVTGFNSIGAAEITENQKQTLKRMLEGTGDNPVGVAITPDGKKVYVTNNASNNIYVIDTATNNITEKVKLGNGSYGVAVTTYGSKVYVAHLKRNVVSVVNTSNNAVTGNISVYSPYGLGFVPDGTKLYIANNLNSSVSVVDTATNTVTKNVSVGSHPIGVAVTPDGKKVYVANNESNNVSVINTTTNTVTSNVPVGFNSHGIAITPDGKAVYVVSNDHENKNGTVSVINTTTNNVTTNISVGSHPIGVAASPDGTKMYVTNKWDWTVSVIDTTTNTVIETVEVGIMPLGVAITPDGTRVYVANEWDWTVSVIDTTTNLVIETVKLPLRSTTPIITWRKPVDIIYGTALSDIQLNAVATDPYTRNEVNGTPVYTPVKGTKLGPGMHTLRIDFIPEDTSAYNKVSKTVTISVKSIPEISWSNPENITYGTALSNTQLNATSTDPVTGNGVDGTYFYTLANVTKIVSRITVLSTGVHTLHVDFTPKDTATYTNVSKNVTINVTKSPLKVKWDEPDDIIYGKALGSTQLNAVVNDPYTGNEVPGISVYTPPSGTILDGGTHPLNFSFIPKDTANYTNASKDVTINILPNAEFSADVIFGPPPLTVKFTDESTGNPTEWEWNFGDGDTSTEQNPEHKYRKTGTYDVKLTAINSAGRNKETKINYYVTTKDKKIEVDYINVTTGS